VTGESKPKAALISNRLAATLALILTGFVAALDIRYALFGPINHSSWLLSPFRSWPLWLTAAVNALVYLYLLWIFVSFFRGTTGKERVLVLGWAIGITLYPLKAFFPAAGGPIQYADATAMGVAFLAALAIFLEFYAARETQIETSADDR
jgi:hypothetical protein